LLAEYIDHMGDDLMVVNAARVSMNKESKRDYDNFKDGNTPLHETDSRLISYLARHNHWTPFSHPQITLRETVPIFVARQRFKHVVGFTYNEVSRRYVDDPPEFHVPSSWRGRAANVKQGSSEEACGGQLNKTHRYHDFIEIAEELYTTMLKEGVCPEQARMVLPQSMLTSYYVTGSLAAFARAYKLRVDPHAQAEIRDLAAQWGKIIEPLYPVSWKALIA
jgi:thymidylate synthase (FAD)